MTLYKYLLYFILTCATAVYSNRQTPEHEEPEHEEPEHEITPEEPEHEITPEEPEHEEPEHEEPEHEEPGHEITTRDFSLWFKTKWKLIRPVIDAHGPSESTNQSTSHMIKQMMRMKLFRDSFGYAVPTLAIIWWIVDTIICSGGTGLEIGCGKGFIASLIQAALPDDCLYIATDDKSSHGTDKPHTSLVPVEKISGKDVVTKYTPEANCLIIIWPGFNDKWAAEALALFTEHVNQQSRVIYWGEGAGGCTADERFHALLDEKYEIVKELGPQQWNDIHDLVYIYRPKSETVDDT